MAVRTLDGHGLVIDGHQTAIAAARAQAKQWLKGKQVDDWDADSMTESARCQRAWWGGDALGFVGEDHPQASPVTVVSIPDGVLARIGGAA